MNLNIQNLIGNWIEGFALNLHTTSSTPIYKKEKIIIEGVVKEVEIQNEIIGWDTKRPEIAEHLYQLKYCQDKSRIPIISDISVKFLNTKHNWKIDVIVPIPPSNTSRNFQPVYELAKEISKISNIPVDLNSLKKLKPTNQLKSEEDPIQRKTLLTSAFDIQQDILKDKNVLLFDDLYRSGETLNAVCDIIKNKGGAASVYVLTITKTRKKR